MTADPLALRRDDERFMRLAHEICRDGIDAGQTPFGACIARAGQILARGHNRVWVDTDPSAHAEVVAIREACRRVGNIHLEGATLYSTTEPCPMCFGAIHWAGIRRIVYGARIEDAAGFGFDELRISNRQLSELGGARIEIVPGVLAGDSLELFRLWASRAGRAY